MSSSTPKQDDVVPIAPDNVSDYGSDLDEGAFELLSQVESQQVSKAALIASIEDIPVPAEHETPGQRIHVRVSRLQQGNNSWSEDLLGSQTGDVREASVEVEYDEDNRRSFNPNRPDDEREQTPALDDHIHDGKDTRTPLQRFRTKPKKPLSVTDLVSPAWCEQQYEYSLTKFGRVRKTPAMKQGSSVHKKLEEQVHQVVPVETVSREDRFALRIWNTIEGVRALREDGLTREMEVFGVVEGEVVIGIIDEISCVCPDEQMEEAVLGEIRTASSSKGKGGRGKKADQLPEGQKTLKDFLTSSQQNGSLLENNAAFLGTLHHDSEETIRRTFYLKDIKTRQSRSLPSPGAPSRPTHMQLMLYHRLLSSLAANEVPADTIFERYGLNPLAQFSDKFIAEIANLNILPTPPSQETNGEGREDPLTELLTHNTLTSLWSLMVSEFARTFPASPSPDKPTISPLLVAEFRSASARRKFASADEDEIPAGSLLGQRCFPFDAFVLDRYLRNEMAWWKGERPTVGVEVEEAFKCRICEFAEECTWRATKVEEALRKVQLRKDGASGRSVI